MRVEQHPLDCDVLIIGTGMAGMAASLFAVQDGLDAVQVGVTGEINFASGLLDVLGVHPMTEQRLVDNPWEGLARLIEEQPRHPYARLEVDTIRGAMQRFLAFLQAAGYPYVCDPERNLYVVTPVGTVKPTYAVPHTMAQGAAALAARQTCLLVDFKGLKGYSARQIALGLAHRWPGLRTARVEFPDLQGELYTERMARALEAPEIRRKLAQAIRPHLDQAAVVGLPAIMGVYRTVEIMADLQHELGRPVFEIPTMVPAVTGLRLRETFEQHLPAMGLRAFHQQRALAVERLPEGSFLVDVGPEQVERRIRARSVILASGRFFGRGLHAERSGIRETIFNLPVCQPAERAVWHRKDLLHKEGHPINQAGIEIDRRFRPVNPDVEPDPEPVYPNLFAAGAILAHQDWIRQKCGSGLAIATAFGAVRSCKDYLQGLSGP